MTQNPNSLAPLRNLQPPLLGPRDHRCQHGIEQRLRDEAVEWRSVLTTLDRAYVGAGPQEAVQFGDHDPAPIGIEAEMLLHSRRDFDAVGGMLRRLRGDRHHQQFGSIADDPPVDHDHHRPVLAPILFALRRLIRPEIGVGQNVSRFRYRP